MVNICPKLYEDPPGVDVLQSRQIHDLGLTNRHPGQEQNVFPSVGGVAGDGGDTQKGRNQETCVYFSDSSYHMHTVTSV